MTVQQVLTDYSGPIKWSLHEGKENGGKLYVEGKCGQADQPTANGRIYSRRIMEREIEKLQSRIKAGSLLGAMDHPGDGKSRLKDAAHIVRALRMEDDGGIYGRYEIVEESDNGRNLAAFLRAGATIGMSSRGMGSTKTTKLGEEVGEDFRLTTFDFVVEPAVSDAYPALVSEDVNTTTITSEDLRSKFPAQIKAIEEGAMAIAQRTIEEAAEDEKNALIREVAEETLAQHKVKVESEVRAALKAEMAEDFAIKLTRSLQSLREDIAAEIRAEIASDPAEASAKVKLTKIGEMLGFAPNSATTQKALSELEAVRKEKCEIEENAKGLALTARNLAWRLFMEQKIAKRDDDEFIRELVDLDTIRSSEELNRKLENAIKRADALREEREKAVSTEVEEERKKVEELEKELNTLRSERDRRNKEIQETIAHLKTSIEKREARFAEREEELSAQLEEFEGKNQSLEEALLEAKELTEQLEAYEFANRRTQGHPRRNQVLGETKRRGLRTKESINQLAEDLETSFSENGAAERIRRSLGRGREHAPSILKENASETGKPRASIEDLEEFGIDISEIKKLFPK